MKILQLGRTNVLIEHGKDTDPPYSPEAFAEIIATSGCDTIINDQYGYKGKPYYWDGKHPQAEADLDIAITQSMTALNALDIFTIHSCADFSKNPLPGTQPIPTRKPGSELFTIEIIAIEQMGPHSRKFHRIQIGEENTMRLLQLEVTIERGTFDLQLHRYDKDGNTSNDKIQPFRGLRRGRYHLTFNSLDLEEISLVLYQTSAEDGEIDIIGVTELPQPGNCPDDPDREGFYQLYRTDKHSYLSTGTPQYNYTEMESWHERLICVYDLHRFVNQIPGFLSFHAKTEEILSMFWNQPDQRQFVNAGHQLAAMLVELACYQYDLTGTRLLVDEIPEVEFTRAVCPFGGGFKNFYDFIPRNAPLTFKVWEQIPADQLLAKLRRLIELGIDFIPTFDIAKPHLEVWREVMNTLGLQFNKSVVFNGASQANEWLALPDVCDRTRQIFEAMEA